MCPKRELALLPSVQPPSFIASPDLLQLHVAVSLGVEQLVREMLHTKNALSEFQNDRGWTPLQLAVARGDPKIIQVLWDLQTARHGQPPLLHLAAANQHRGAAKFLKQKKMDKKAKYMDVTARDVAMELEDEILADVIEKRKKLTGFECCLLQLELTKKTLNEDIQELLLYPPRTRASPRKMKGSRPERKRRGRRSAGYGSRGEERERGQKEDGTRGSVEWQGSGKRVRDDGEADRTEVTEPKRGRKTEEEAESRSEWKSTDEEIRHLKPLGLPNLGNTCYMSSVLQCLYHIKSLTSRFKDLQGDRGQGGVVKAMVKLWASLQNGVALEKSAQELKNVLARRDENFGDYKEKEAHDLLSHLLECLHTDMATASFKNNTRDGEADGGVVNGLDQLNSFISDLFRIVTKTTVTCHVNNPSDLTTQYEAALNLSLPVSKNGPRSLEEVLDKYFRKQNIEWDCTRCNNEHECEHKVVICKLPSVLVLHLSRVSEKTTSDQKLQVTYPMKDLFVNHTNDRTSRSYNLTAVCCHDGGMEGGHYRSFCKLGEQWFSFNDQFVERVRSNVAQDRPSAHILFYEAMDTPQ